MISNPELRELVRPCRARSAPTDATPRRRWMRAKPEPGLASKVQGHNFRAKRIERPRAWFSGPAP
eukprot:6988034-Alexandrium_andersonii.AAC.1